MAISSGHDTLECIEISLLPLPVGYVTSEEPGVASQSSEASPTLWSTAASVQTPNLVDRSQLRLSFLGLVNISYPNQGEVETIPEDTNADLVLLHGPTGQDNAVPSDRLLKLLKQLPECLECGLQDQAAIIDDD